MSIMLDNYQGYFIGLSTDDKPKEADYGDLFREMDTSVEYMFDGKGWVEQKYNLTFMI